MSNRLFQGLIHQMRDAIGRNAGVIDETGTIISCSDLNRIGKPINGFTKEIFVENERVCVGGNTFRCFGTPMRPEYAVFVDGSDDLAGRYVNICYVALSNIKQFYDEKYDRGNFIKNVMLDNILPGDIYLKARELRFNNEIPRVVLLIRVSEPNETVVYDAIQNLFPERAKDFVINVSETDIALVKEVKPNTETKYLEKLALSIADSLSTELFSQVNVGIGTVVMSVQELALSFKEAQVSLEVGKVFDTEKRVINYDNLGLARLIYQLPTTLCEMFLHEVFKRGSIESLDQETLFTIQKFFENNLNVSETSRKLFVHRNTLVYRLEKIRKITGLDLREFDDAIVFKVALMVKKYLDAKPVKY